MAHIARSIDVAAPVDTVHEEWLHFEERPRCPAHSLSAMVKWRAEVLTMEPTRTGTRITLKVEYDAAGGDPGLSGRIEAALQSFTSFFEARHGRAAAAQPA